MEVLISTETGTLNKSNRTARAGHRRSRQSPAQPTGEPHTPTTPPAPHEPVCPSSKLPSLYAFNRPTRDTQSRPRWGQIKPSQWGQISLTNPHARPQGEALAITTIDAAPDTGIVRRAAPQRR